MGAGFTICWGLGFCAPQPRATTMTSERKTSAFLWQSASVSPLSVPVVVSMLSAPSTTADHGACTKEPCITQCHSKNYHFLSGNSTKMSSPRVFLVIALPLLQGNKPVLKRRARAAPPPRILQNLFGFCRRVLRNLLRSRNPTEEPLTQNPKGSGELWERGPAFQTLQSLFRKLCPLRLTWQKCLSLAFSERVKRPVEWGGCLHGGNVWL